MMFCRIRKSGLLFLLLALFARDASAGAMVSREASAGTQRSSFALSPLVSRLASLLSETQLQQARRVIAEMPIMRAIRTVSLTPAALGVGGAGSLAFGLMHQREQGKVHDGQENVVQPVYDKNYFEQNSAVAVERFEELAQSDQGAVVLTAVLNKHHSNFSAQISIERLMSCFDSLVGFSKGCAFLGRLAVIDERVAKNQAFVDKVLEHLGAFLACPQEFAGVGFYMLTDLLCEADLRLVEKFGVKVTEHFGTIVQMEDGCKFLQRLLEKDTARCVVTQAFMDKVIEHFDAVIHAGGHRFLAELLKKKNQVPTTKFGVKVLEHFDNLIAYSGYVQEWSDFLYAFFKKNPSMVKNFSFSCYLSSLRDVFVLQELDHTKLRVLMCKDSFLQHLQEEANNGQKDPLLFCSLVGLYKDLFGAQDVHNFIVQLTPTQVHFMLNFNSKRVGSPAIARYEHIYGLQPELKPLIKKVIALEKSYGDKGYCTFVHAQTWDFDFILRFYKDLMALRKGWVIPADFMFLQVRDYDEQGELARKKLVQEGLGRYLGFSFDEEASKKVLFMNYAFLANLGQPGCSTARYFSINTAGMWNNPGLIRNSRHSFVACGMEDLYKKHEKEIEKLWDLHASASEFGNLLVVAVPKDKVDEYVYNSGKVYFRYAGGVRTSARVNFSRTESVATIYEALHTNPSAVNFGNSDVIEFCLPVLGKVLDPQGDIKVVSVNAADPEKYAEFEKKYAELMAKIKVDFAASKSQSDMLDSQEPQVVAHARRGLAGARAAAIVNVAQ